MLSIGQIFFLRFLINEIKICYSKKKVTFRLPYKGNFFFNIPKVILAFSPDVNHSKGSRSILYMKYHENKWSYICRGICSAGEKSGFYPITL